MKFKGCGRCEQRPKEGGWFLGPLARRMKINWWPRDATTVAPVLRAYPNYMFTNLYMMTLCSAAKFATVLEQCFGFEACPCHSGGFLESCSWPSRCQAKTCEHMSRKTDYILESFDGHLSQLICTSMIFNLWCNRLRQMSPDKAKRVFKTVFYLKPKRPRVKNDRSQFRPKRFGSWFFAILPFCGCAMFGLEF